jgi:hypothetical protein
MSPLTKRLGKATLVGLVLLGSVPPAAQAQRNPYAVYAPAYPSGYWGYSFDPYGLHGAADVIRSTGQFLNDRERAISARLDNRRKALEQWLWERDHLPTPVEERKRLKARLTEHSLDPSLTEIWSAEVLNLLLDDIQKRPGYYATENPLTPEVVAKINLTTGVKGGNFGLLKDGKVTWPLLFRRDVFADDRQNLEQLVTRAVKKAAAGDMDAKAIEEMAQRVNGLHDKLKGLLRAAAEGDTWTPAIYTEAKSFLFQFADAIKVLRQPDAAQYVTGKYAAQGKTVGELIKYMTDNGLRFAAATPGTEAAYTALHRAMTGKTNNNN